MRNSRRGGAMALYAMFLALVGLPLLVATVDASRVWVRRAELANAVEAACAAYAHLPDEGIFLREGKLKLEGEARSEGYRIFAYNLPEGGALTGMSYRVSERFSDTIIAMCAGEADFRPMILAEAASFHFTYSTTVKVKYGSAGNWR
jgi:hypothetical protein